MDEDKKKLVELAIGRILRIMSRPHHLGDEAEYDRCRGIILDAAGIEGNPVDDRPSWTRDRLKGAAGD